MIMEAGVPLSMLPGGALLLVVKGQARFQRKQLQMPKWNQNPGLQCTFSSDQDVKPLNQDCGTATSLDEYRDNVESIFRESENDSSISFYKGTDQDRDGAAVSNEFMSKLEPTQAHQDSSRLVVSQNTTQIAKKTPCKHCGNKNHTANNCSHKVATCDTCGKVGHVDTVCRQRKPLIHRQLQSELEPCEHCGRNHHASGCWHKAAICRSCGKSGHTATVCWCPRWPPTSEQVKQREPDQVSPKTSTESADASSQNNHSRQSISTCKHCGLTNHMHTAKNCKLKAATCDICGKLGHVDTVCRQRKPPIHRQLQSEVEPCEHCRQNHHASTRQQSVAVVVRAGILPQCAGVPGGCSLQSRSNRGNLIKCHRKLLLKVLMPPVRIIRSLTPDRVFPLASTVAERITL